MQDSDIVATRRRRLRQAIEDLFDGKLVNFIEKTGINSGELSALLRNKSFGEKKARSLEDAAGLPRYFLDRKEGEHPEPSPTINEPNPLLDLWPYLLPDEKQQIMADIEQKAAHNRRVMQELARYEPQAEAYRTVRVADKRKRQVQFDWPDRREQKKEGEK